VMMMNMEQHHPSVRYRTCGTLAMSEHRSHSPEIREDDADSGGWSTTHEFALSDLATRLLGTDASLSSSLRNILTVSL